MAYIVKFRIINILFKNCIIASHRSCHGPCINLIPMHRKFRAVVNIESKDIIVAIS